MLQGTPRLQLVDGVKPLSPQPQVGTAKYQLHHHSLTLPARHIRALSHHSGDSNIAVINATITGNSGFNTKIKYVLRAAPTNTSSLGSTAHPRAAEVESDGNLGERG